MTLYSAIQELLARYDFVSIPGIGSFVQKYEPAKLADTGSEFLPPVQTLSFDTARSFNDELLEQYLCDKQTLTTQQAAQQVKVFVDEIKSKLNSKSKVEFPGVGALSKSDKGDIVFEPADELHRASDSFGLKSVEVTKKTETVTKQAAESLVHKPKPQVAKTPSSMASVSLTIMLATAAMAILMLVGGMMIFIPELRFWGKAEVSDNLLPIQKPVETDSNDSVAMETPLVVNNDSIDGAPQEVVETVEEITDKKRALFYQEPDDKTYYLIAGSFAQIENAQVLVNSLVKQGYKPEILQSDGRFRVSISKFSDRNRALRELAKLRQQKQTESVWLLGL